MSTLPEQFTRDAEKVLAHRIVVQKTSQKTFNLLRVGTVKGEGHFAALGSNVLILDIADAARILDMEPGKVNRIDVTFKPGADTKRSARPSPRRAKGHGVVRTPEEQGEAMGNALDGMQTGFSLCGLAALVVGLFLVYNALSVCVDGKTARNRRAAVAGGHAAAGSYAVCRRGGLPRARRLTARHPAGDRPGLPRSAAGRRISCARFSRSSRPTRSKSSWWLMGLAMSCGMLDGPGRGAGPRRGRLPRESGLGGAPGFQGADLEQPVLAHLLEPRPDGRPASCASCSAQQLRYLQAYCSRPAVACRTGWGPMAA